MRVCVYSAGGWRMEEEEEEEAQKKREYFPLSSE
jgi:hypothetical protein